jgi:cardiolipin synthase
MSSPRPHGQSEYHQNVPLRSVFTAPNVITLVRIAALPYFVLLMADGRVVAGSWFFGLLAFTDWIDGYIARRFNQVSEFGKVLDPVADRLIFFVGIGTVMYFNFFPAWLGIVILVREVAIAVLMVGATALGMERFPVTKMGKQAAFGLMCAVPWITIGTAGAWWRLFAYAGWIVAVPGVLFSYVSFVRYLPVVRANMSSGRRG